MIKNKFNYLIDKIKSSTISDYPFKHVYIENFLDDGDFHKIISSNQIDLKNYSNDNELFKDLFLKKYKVIQFPGTTIDYKKYIDKRSNGSSKLKPTKTSCETEGIALRLNPTDETLVELERFLASDPFNSAIAEKFNIDFKECTVDCGIQKYLDGYEISPHPDVRRKAATYMVNINPSSSSESLKFHTQYLRFKKEFSYVQKIWEDKPNIDRDWVPWDWCESLKTQEKNNSIVLFSPSNDTLHGIKTNYDHLKTQRTQLYGNLWYKNNDAEYSLNWEKLLEKDYENPNVSTPSYGFSRLFKSLKYRMKKILPKDPNIGDRVY